MKANDQIRAGCKTPLLEPATVKVALAADQATQQHILRSRDDIRSILSCNGSDTRLMVIVGPCSIHDVDEAIEYASLLSKAAELHRHELFIVMRVYVEKPRSTVGWKGLVHEPDYAAPTRSISKTLKPFVSSSNRSSQPELNKGVLLSRKVMLDVAQRGLPVATELLNPLLAQYFDDITSLGVIGARTTESQTHRELASSMPMPVGFKNGTDGSLKVATDAMTSASHSHTVVGFDDHGHMAYHMSSGNPDTFVILRGGSDGPNFDAEHVASAHAELRRAGRTPAVVVDCSHGNSMKDYRNQAVVAACLADQIASGVPIKGVMIESNIHQGRQDVIEDAATGQRRAKYGVSITDGCIGWQETLTILGELAAAVKIRQQKLGMAVVNTTLQVDCEKSRMTQQVTEVAV
ncbi:hypothetical protein E4U57_002208 [Claviceps arundinis]|uniref:Phospho-2-dehydro-3-deoxyheptonate aldolase n=1 Tax=Claviceps arundinis TaxID=1623583 RepID=A0ABQ7PKI5_9HYPO|nr:hypothetical protein E4U57_002208 [Claviceps arundinis]